MLPLNIRQVHTLHPVFESVHFASLLAAIIFGFVLGLLVSVGTLNIIVIGSHNAGEWLLYAGYEKSATIGFIAAIAPYIILVPLFIFALWQVLSIKSLQSFCLFVVAIILGFVGAYFGV